MNLLNTSGRCSMCSGVVKNIAGKRYTRDRLDEVHRATCPGVLRSTRQRGAS